MTAELPRMELDTVWWRKFKFHGRTTVSSWEEEGPGKGISKNYVVTLEGHKRGQITSSVGGS